MVAFPFQLRFSKMLLAGAYGSRMGLLRLLTALLPLLLSACTTMSADECRVANWRDVGYLDGKQGQSLTLLNRRMEACAKAQVTLDAPLYHQGREQGLQQFCRIDNAAPHGLSGRYYQGVCPAEIDGEFRVRFDAGRAVYDARKEVEYINSRIAAAERKLRDSYRDERREKDKRRKEREKERSGDRDRDDRGRGNDWWHDDDDDRRIARDYHDRRDRLRAEIKSLDRERQRARDRVRDAEQEVARYR